MCSCKQHARTHTIVDRTCFDGAYLQPDEKLWPLNSARSHGAAATVEVFQMHLQETQHTFVQVAAAVVVFVKVPCNLELTYTVAVVYYCSVH